VRGKVSAIERELDRSKCFQMCDEWFDRLEIRKGPTTAGDRECQVGYERLALARPRMVSRRRYHLEQAMTQVSERRRVHAEVQDPAIERPHSVGLDLDWFRFRANVNNRVPPRQFGRKPRGLDDGDVGERRGIAETAHDE
jgi:hypothetical protein